MQCAGSVRYDQEVDRFVTRLPRVEKISSQAGRANSDPAFLSTLEEVAAELGIGSPANKLASRRQTVSRVRPQENRSGHSLM
jgi:hypothetical protein